jgi:hypothetical protein
LCQLDHIDSREQLIVKFIFKTPILLSALLICFGLHSEALADIKVAKYAPCEKIYFAMAKRIKKLQETHYAFATTGGRSMNASGTSCGYSDGFDTVGQRRSSALAQCRIYSKKFGYPGECKVIESK